MTERRNPIRVKPVVDHERGTVTFAVTFKWQRPWAMDHCEVGVIGGELRRAIIAHFKDYEQLAGLDGCETWEPLEERHIGRGPSLPYRFHNEQRAPFMDRDPRTDKDELP